MALPTVVNVWLAFEPRVVMAAMQTTIMSASMTAYSTAVGPSSLFKKFRTQLITLFIVCSFRQPGDPPSGHNVGGPMVLRPALQRVCHFEKVPLSTQKATLEHKIVGQGGNTVK